MGKSALEAKVAFLSSPDGYPDKTTAVSTVETHMSWVFLTDTHAWKLKKPFRLDHHDLSSAAARREHCLLEVRLNRRLSEGVYLDVVALAEDEAGRLALGGPGTAVDWLVKMRRLPAERMLDALIRANALRVDDVKRVVRLLGHFYRQGPRPAVEPRDFRARIAAGIEENCRELGCAEYRMPREQVEAIAALQRAFLAREGSVFDERAASGRIVEGHGDLRPEHVCLEPRPQIIDCLEFSKELRTLDAAEELAFLALECERLGAPGLRHVIFAAYAEATGDRPPEPLVDFYQAYHAMVRAKLAAWHLRDPHLRLLPRWPAQARQYLLLARDHLGK